MQFSCTRFRNGHVYAFSHAADRQHYCTSADVKKCILCYKLKNTFFPGYYVLSTRGLTALPLFTWTALLLFFVFSRSTINLMDWWWLHFVCVVLYRRMRSNWQSSNDGIGDESSAGDSHWRWRRFIPMSAAGDATAVTLRLPVYARTCRSVCAMVQGRRSDSSWRRRLQAVVRWSHRSALHRWNVLRRRWSVRLRCDTNWRTTTQDDPLHCHTHHQRLVQFIPCHFGTLVIGLQLWNSLPADLTQPHHTSRTAISLRHWSRFSSHGVTTVQCELWMTALARNTIT